MRRISVIISTVLMVCAVLGCTKIEEQSASSALKQNIVRISPSSLFEGETKKLEPHLGLISGAVKVAYLGPKNTIGCKYEIWEKGERKKREGILGSSFNGGRFDGEFSVSLKKEDSKPSHYTMTTVFSDSSGYSQSVTQIGNYASSSWGPRQLQDTIEVSDSAETAVWGLVKGEESNYISTSESIEEMAKKAEWALVIKLFLEDK